MLFSTIISSTKSSTFHAFRRGVAAIALLGSGLAGCAMQTDAGSDEAAAAVANEDVLLFAGDTGTSSRVRRTVAGDGSESLHGETEVTLSGARRRIIEDVTIDPRGHLSRAEITVLGGEAREVRVHMLLSPSDGIAQVTSPDGRTAWRVPSDKPWVYAPWSHGRSTVTPVSAWVAMRATVASPWVHVVAPEARGSYQSPRDQIAVPTEAGTTVVLGLDAADIDGTFVSRLHVGGSVAAARVARHDLVL